MKTLQLPVLVAALLALPVIANAQQSGSTVTRAQLREELVELERAGYNPGHPSPYYPSDLLAAENKVREMKDRVSAAATAPQAISTANSGSSNGSVTHTPEAVSRALTNGDSYRPESAAETDKDLGGVAQGAVESGSRGTKTVQSQSLFAHH